MRYMFSSRFALLALVAVILGGSGCASDPTAPTPDTGTQSLEVYSGPLDPGGTSTYLFTLSQTTTVRLMLAGAVLDAPLRSISPVLRLQLSRWTGTECETLTQIDTTPRLTAALHIYAEPGSYCAVVTDPGNLTEPAGVTMRIVAPALLRTTGAPGTVVFSSAITPGGRSSRSFEASGAGVVTVTLTGLSADAAEVGVGVGVLAPDGSGCRYSQIVRTLPGGSPQITAQVDAGDYCAAVIDVGTLTQNETFSMTITHP